MNKQTFNKLHGIRLRRERTEARATQDQVSKALKINQGGYSKIENGLQEMSVYEQYLFSTYIQKRILGRTIRSLKKATP